MNIFICGSIFLFLMDYMMDINTKMFGNKEGSKGSRSGSISGVQTECTPSSSGVSWCPVSDQRGKNKTVFSDHLYNCDSPRKDDLFPLLPRDSDAKGRSRGDLGEVAQKEPRRKGIDKQDEDTKSLYRFDTVQFYEGQLEHEILMDVDPVDSSPVAYSYVFANPKERRESRVGSMSAVQKENMRSMVGVKWNAVSDPAGSNNDVSSQYFKMCDVSSIEEEEAPLLWGINQKRSFRTCCADGSGQRKASKKAKEEVSIEFFDESRGIRIDGSARAEELIVEENLCVARTEVRDSEDVVTIKELALPKLIAGTAERETLALDETIGTGRTEFSMIGSESISKGLFSTEVFCSSTQKLSEHRSNVAVITLMKNIVGLMCEIDNIEINIGDSSAIAVDFLKQFDLLMCYIKEILGKSEEIDKTENTENTENTGTKDITEIKRSEDSTDIQALFEKFDACMRDIRKILEGVKKAGNEVANELEGTERKEIINAIDVIRRIVYPDGSPSSEGDLWGWNFDICGVTELENEFEVSFNLKKECYQKTPYNKKAFEELTVVGKDEYVFVLTREEEEDSIKADGPNKEEVDAVNVDDEIEKRFSNICKDLERALCNCIEILLVEKRLKDVNTVLKQLRSIQEKRYLSLMIMFIMDNLKKGGRSVEEGKYHKKLDVLDESCLEWNQRDDAVWEILFEHIVEGSDGKITGEIEKKCFVFALEHIELRSAQVLINKIWDGASLQDKEDYMQVLLNCFILLMDDYCENRLPGRRDTAFKKAKAMYPGGGSESTESEQANQAELTPDARNDDSVKPLLIQKGQLSSLAVIEDKDVETVLNKLIEKYQCLQKKTVIGKTVREVLDCMTVDKEESSELFPRDKGDDKKDVTKDSMHKDLLELHEQFKDFIDYLYEQQQFIKEEIPRVVPLVNQIKNLISKASTNLIDLLLWSSEKRRFSVMDEIFLYFLLYPVRNVAVDEVLGQRSLLNKVMLVVWETFCTPGAMTAIECNGKKRFFKKCKDILELTNLSEFLLKIDIWSPLYFSGIWINQSPFLRKFFIYCLSMHINRLSDRWDKNYCLIKSLATCDIKKGILFGDSLDLKMHLVESLSSLFRFKIKDMTINSNDKKNIETAVDFVVNSCRQKNIFSKQLDDVMNKKELDEVTKEKKVGALQKNILEIWLDILDYQRYMKYYLLNDGFGYDIFFWTFWKHIGIIYNSNQKKLISHFYSDCSTTEWPILTKRKLDIDFYFCDAFSKQYIPLKSTGIPITTQSIILRDITCRVIAYSLELVIMPLKKAVNCWKNYYIPCLKRWKDLYDVKSVFHDMSGWKNWRAERQVIFLCCFLVQKDSDFLIEIYKECARNIMSSLSVPGKENNALILLGRIVKIKITYLLEYVLTEEGRISYMHYERCYKLYKDVVRTGTQKGLENNQALLIGARQIMELISFCKMEKEILGEEVCEPIEALQYIIDELSAQDIISAKKNFFVRYEFCNANLGTAVVFYSYWKILQSDESVFTLLLASDKRTEEIWSKDNIELYWKIASRNNKTRWLRDAVDLVGDLEKFLPQEILEEEKLEIARFRKEKRFLKASCCNLC